jgi:hypothetical protein
LAQPKLGPLPPMQVKSGDLQPGAWAAYLITRGARMTSVRMAALERLGRAQWFEFTMTEPAGQRMVFKVLVEGKLSKPKRLRKALIQIGAQKPILMPPELLNRGMPQLPFGDVEMDAGAKRKGKESVRQRRVKIRVPAGLFTATHLRNKDSAGQVQEIWLSNKVAGWPLVKMRRPGMQMVLTGYGKSARSHITAEPVMFDPALLHGLVPPH